MKPSEHQITLALTLVDAECVGGENVDNAAARILAAAYRNLKRENTHLRGEVSLANHHARGRWGDYERALSERDELRAENARLRSALIAFYGAASTTPDMGGGSRLIGWNRVYLDKAYEGAKRLLLPNASGEPHGPKTK